MKNSKRKQKVVYTYGVFDLLHIGHIKSLKQAKELGDFLIVGVFKDSVAGEFKRQPIWNQNLRKKTIEELGIADLVVYQGKLKPDEKYLKEFDVSIIAKGPGASFENMEFSNKIKKVMLEYCGLTSTSDIIKKIKTK